MTTQKRILLVFIALTLITLCILALSLNRTTTKLTTTPIFVTPTVRSVLNPSSDILATFTGNVSYSGFDKDGDSYFDYLRVDVEVDVREESEFYFSPSLAITYSNVIDSGGLIPNPRFRMKANNILLQEGIQQVPLYFDGNVIRHLAIIDGPYIVIITISSEGDSTYDAIYFTIDTLNRRDFWYEDQGRCDYFIQMFCRLLN